MDVPPPNVGTQEKHVFFARVPIPSCRSLRACVTVFTHTHTETSECGCGCGCVGWWRGWRGRRRPGCGARSDSRLTRREGGEKRGGERETGRRRMLNAAPALKRASAEHRARTATAEGRIQRSQQRRGCVGAHQELRSWHSRRGCCKPAGLRSLRRTISGQVPIPACASHLP